MKTSTPLHRYALLVLVVCLAAATGCGRSPTGQLDLTTLLPGEPAWLVSSDIPALRGWEFWPQVEKNWFDSDGLLDRFFEETGIDPDKDLDQMLVGIYQEGNAVGGFTAVLTGRFNRETLVTNLEEQGLHTDSWREYTLICPDATRHTDPGIKGLSGFHLVFFDESAIGIAEGREGATGLIDRLLDGGASLDLHPGFGPLLAQVDRTAPLWGAGLLADETTAEWAAQLPVRGMIPDLDNFGFSIRVAPGFQLTCVTLLPTAEGASKLTGQLNGWIKLGAGLIQANPQWFDRADSSDGTLRLVAETLDQVVVSADGPAVSLVAEIPAELIRQADRATSPGPTDPPRQESTPAHP